MKYKYVGTISKRINNDIIFITYRHIYIYIYSIYYIHIYINADRELLYS